eukprot:m.35365 g.35365  ORF g.35365 m.35365 type:complete len:60 (+) comp14408_c0_seq7:399-578(+)
MSYLQAKGYRCIPINPGAAKRNEKILGEPAFPSLTDIPEEIEIDMVDVYREPFELMGAC